MAEGWEDPKVQLRLPLTYRGNSIYQVYLTGSPFRGVESLYDELRGKTDKSLFLVGDPSISLDAYENRDLGIEATAYAIRADVSRRNANVEGVITNLDKLREILHYVHKHTRDSVVRDAAFFQFDLLRTPLKTFLADRAVSHRNYSWAKVLLQEALEKYPRTLDDLTYVDDEGRQATVLTDFFNPTLEISLKDIEKRLQAVTERERKEPNANNIVPITVPHPESLGALLTKYNEARDYEQAGRIQRELEEKVDFPLLFGPGDHYLKWIARYLLVNALPPNVGFTIERDRLTIERRSNLPSSENLVLVGGSGIARYFHTQEWLVPRLMGMIHSDDFVFQFERFPDGVVIYQEKKYPY